MNFDTTKLQKIGFKNVTPSVYFGHELDIVLLKPGNFMDSDNRYILIKQFELLDAKAALVWHSMGQVMYKESNDSTNNPRILGLPLRINRCLLCLVAKNLSADVLLMLKTGTLQLSPNGNLVIVDEENNLFWGEWYKDAQKVLFGK